MFEKIKNNLSEGTNIIITGSGHLEFFKEKFPDAEFPLEKYSRN